MRQRPRPTRGFLLANISVSPISLPFTNYKFGTAGLAAKRSLGECPWAEHVSAIGDKRLRFHCSGTAVHKRWRPRQPNFELPPGALNRTKIGERQLGGQSVGRSHPLTVGVPASRCMPPGRRDNSNSGKARPLFAVSPSGPSSPTQSTLGSRFLPQPACL
jgi:hypothetical protein